MLKSYQELTVWQKGVMLSVATYHLTSYFPQSELYSITNQMRRAAVSIPSNIAEGYARGHRGEYTQFLHVALGSGTELETQCIIAKQLNLAPAGKFAETEQLLEEVLKMLNKLINSISVAPKP